MSYTTDLIKNVTIAGHGGTGKTSLVEHLLFAAGAIAKAETVDSGKTVSDATNEEIERKISIYASLSHIDWKGKKINIFDTPGSSDFIGDVILTLRAAELAIVTVDGRAGIQIETLKLWRHLDNHHKARAIFITKLDDDRSDYEQTLADIKQKLKINPLPICLPIGTGSDFTGVVDIISGQAYAASDDSPEKAIPLPEGFSERLEEGRLHLMEAAAEGDDELMEKYLDSGELSPEDVKRGLILALAANRIVPVFCGVTLRNSGIVPLLDFIAETGPSPLTSSDTVINAEGELQEEAIDPNQAFAAFVIKTYYDQFSGKLNWIKLIRGRLSNDTDIINVGENKKERIGKIYRCLGRKLEETTELFAGDVGIISKVASAKTNDSLCAPEAQLSFKPLSLPAPVHAVAIEANLKKDEDKLGEFLVRAAEEDKTFRYAYNSETKEAVISGMGELHVNIILDKLKNNQKIEVQTRLPRVAYRESIGKKAGAEYTHKKQTGGHGQYARVVLEIAPLERGEHYKFINAIFGGSISKGYIPGVEKGVQEAMANGVLAGYPVVDVEVKVLDGKEHPVDSSELAFKLAARNAFRESMKQALPSLLEPIMKLTVYAEDQYLGDVMSDLSSRRGRILGQDSLGGGIAEIKSLVPQAELLRYSIDLRAMTSGTGSFEVEFDHYASISGKTADDVIKAAQAFKASDSDD